MIFRSREWFLDQIVFPKSRSTHSWVQWQRCVALRRRTDSDSWLMWRTWEFTSSRTSVLTLHLRVLHTHIDALARTNGQSTGSLLSSEKLISLKNVHFAFVCRVVLSVRAKCRYIPGNRYRSRSNLLLRAARYFAF